MPELKTEFLFTIDGHLDFESIQQIGQTPAGTRLIGAISGGSFDGPRIRGDVLPGYGDWMVLRSDGVRVGDVRMALRTDDAELILVSYQPVYNISADVHERRQAGDVIDPSEYYLRSTPTFETASETYAWLNQIVAVGTGTVTPTGFTNSIFAVL